MTTHGPECLVCDPPSWRRRHRPPYFRPWWWWLADLAKMVGLGAIGGAMIAISIMCALGLLLLTGGAEYHPPRSENSSTTPTVYPLKIMEQP
jgi:hypothetical protein